MMDTDIRLRDSWAAVVGITAVAISQPLLDVVGRNAEFLVAHGASGLDLVLFVVAVAVLGPLVIAGATVMFLVLGRPALLGAHFIVTSMLVAAMVMMALHRSGLDGRMGLAAVIGVTTVVGTAGGAAATLIVPLRRTLRFGWLVPPAVVFIFLVASPAGALLQSPSPSTQSLTFPEHPPDIVVVVFDELPVSSLLGKDGLVDERSYPAFRQLAEEATFYRNVTTVHESTAAAVPAVLTGKLTPPRAVPSAVAHPDNLFTLLSNTHALHVHEPLTGLCPPALCPGDDEHSPMSRLGAIFADLQVIAGHTFLPVDLAANLPPLTEGWRDFGSASPVAAGADPDSPAKTRLATAFDTDRAAEFRHFVREINSSPRPTVHFVHTLLPHSPWEYLETGQTYPASGSVPGADGHRWRDEPWHVAQAHQRHLHQVAFVDSLVAELVARLKAESMYDDALIVITADHGVSFQPGTSGRMLTDDTIGDIAPVPLFVKLPNQRDGATVDLPLTTLDILPTVLDEVGARGDIAADGFVAGEAPERTTRFVQVERGGDIHHIELDLDGSARDDSVQRKFQHFQPRNGRRTESSLLPASTPNVLGSTVESAPSEAEMSVQLDDPSRWADIDPTASSVPVVVSGGLRHSRLHGEVPLALAMNGIVEAVTLAKPSRHGGGFTAMIPVDSIRAGHNDVQVYRIRGTTLHRLPRTDEQVFRIAGNTLVDASGGRFPIEDGFYGNIDSHETADGEVTIRGWAALPTEGRVATAVAAFAGRRFLGVTAPLNERADVAEVHGDTVGRSGFTLTVDEPEQSLEEPILLYAIFGDRAGKLGPVGP